MSLPMSVRHVFLPDHAASYQWFYELRVLPCNNLLTAGHIFIKFGMEVMPLEATPNSCFLISYI
jgi:hypothetical protein